MKKWIISLLLTVAMVVSMIPTAFAEEAVEPIEIAADYSNVVAWSDIDHNGAIDSGETTYTTLSEALNAGGEVKLYRDYDASAEGSIQVGQDTESKLSVVFDLNGKKITSSANGVLNVAKADVTVKDDIGDGSVKTTGEYAIQCSSVDSVLTVQDGHFEGSTGGLAVYQGQTVVNGGTFAGNGYGIYIDNGEVTVNDGFFASIYGIFVITGKVTVIDGECGGSVYGVWVRGGGSALICGGEIFGQQQAVYVDSGSAVITGGSFNSDPSAYVAEGYIATEDAETGMWTVSAATDDDGEVVAWIDRDNDGEIDNGEETYASLQEAVDSIAAMAVADNTILKLNEDVELGETSLTVSSGVFTLDLNGRTINRATSGGSAVVVSGGTMTVTDSSSEKSGSICGVNNAIVMTGGTLHILDGNFFGKTALYLSGGSTTVSGGKITGGTDGTGIYVYYLFGGDVTIEGGEITGDRNGVRGDGDAITITGGSLYGYYAGLQMNAGNAHITGGEIKGRYSGVEVAGGSISLEDGRVSGDDAVLVRKGSASIAGGMVTGSMHGVYIDGGAAVITGGTVIGDIGVQIHQGDVIIQNGDISGRNGVFAFGGKATVSGGYITGEEFGLGVNGGEAVISGGSFVGGQDTETNNYEAVYVWDGSAEITGGSFNSDPSAYVAEGYTVVENEYSGMWRVEESAAVAWLDADLDGEFDAGESKFDSLESAFAAVRTAKEADQAVIRLCADVDAGEVPFYITSGEFALDLNGHNLRSTYTALVLVGGNVIIDDSQPEKLCTISGDKTIAVGGGLLTVSNGMISGDICAISVTGGDVIIKDGNIVDGVYIDYGSLNIEGGSVSGVQVLGGTVTVSGGDVYGGGCGIAAESGTVYISGGLVEGDSCGMEVSGESDVHVLEGGTVSSSNYGMIVHDGTVTVNGGKVSGSERGLVAKGGTVTVEAGGVSGYYDCGLYVDGGDVTVTGGAFSAKYFSVQHQSGSLTITGGRFSSDPSAYVAEGYEVTADAETGMWTVSAATDDDGEVVAWIDRDNDGEIDNGEETYASLQEAVDSIAAMAVADNTILKLNEDVELGETSLTVSAGVLTLDLNGKTISRTPGGGNALEIMGGTVTVTDSAAQKAGAISAANSAILMNGGTLTIEGGNISGYSAIYTCGGSMTVSGGTITGSQEGIYVCCPNGGDVTIENGEISGDRYGVRVDGGNANVNVSGGTVYGFYSGLQMDQGHAFVTGGKVSSRYSGVELFGGSVTVENGEISGEDGIFVIDGAAAISGGTVTGSMHGVYIDGATAVITGGTVSGDIGVQIQQGKAIIQAGDISGRNGVFVFGGKATVEGGTVTGEEFGLGVNGGEAEISGGTFTGGQDTATNNYEGVFVWDGSATITGGSFNSDPSAYVAENYEAVLNADTGYYDVREIASSGLIIVAQPVDYVGMVGEVAEFDVIAKGEGLTYQWYYFDRNVSQWKKSSSTEGYLDVEFKAYRNGQQYKCVITDAEGNTVETDVVSILAKEIELMIDEQPVSHVGAVNDQVVFSCGAVGNGLIYQWYYSTDGGESWHKSYTPGFDTDTLLPILRAYRNGQQYRCRITDVFGTVVETDVVEMAIGSSEVVIAEQPVAVENGVLDRLYTFYVEAEGENLTYQWEVSKDGGETWEKSYNSGFDTEELQVRMYAYRSGYQYRCVVSSGLKNTVVTDAAVLKLQPASVKIVTEPVSRGFMVQKNVHFNVKAEGMDLTYQWYRSNDGGNTWVKTYLDGYDTDTLYFKATAARCALYRCYVTDGSGTEAYSKAAKLTLIDKELVLLRQPEDVYCQNGDTAVFAVEAEGAGLKYQWYASADGGETWAVTWLGGSDTDTLSFKVNETRAAKLYKCVITDAGNNTVETKAVSVFLGTAEEYAMTARLIYFNREYTWRYDMELKNTGNTAISLERLDIVKRKGGVDGELIEQRFNEVENPLVLQPGEVFDWNDGLPWTEAFDFIEYRYVFREETGKQKVVIYAIDLNREMPQISSVAAEVEPIVGNGESRWQFDILLENTGTMDMALEQVFVLKYQGGADGDLVAAHIFAKEWLSELGLDSLAMAPGETYNWGDGHPVVNDFDCMEYVFVFVREDGRYNILTYRYTLLGAAEDDEADKIKPYWNGTEYVWSVGMNLTNRQDSVLELQQIDTVKKLGGENGSIVEAYSKPGEDVGLQLQPGETYVWEWVHPVADDFDFVEIVFTFADAEGRIVTMKYPLRFSHKLPEIEEDDGLVKPRWNGVEYDWRFQMPLTNESDSVLELKRLIIDKREGDENGTPAGGGTFEQEDLMYGAVTLQPGETFVWDDGFPYREDVDYVEYLFVLCDVAGNETEIRYEYRLSHELPEIEDDGLVKPQWNGVEYDWRFNMELVNEGDSALTLERLVIEKRQGGKDGEWVGGRTFEAEELPNINLGNENGPLVLQPGGRWAWNDGHPVVDYFDFMGYTFTFRDEAGQQLDMVFDYPLSHELPEREYPSYADDHGYDLQTLRHDADYSVQVADGVYWVPAASLGSSSYTNAQIQQLLTEAPEAKQQKIDSLYEALQLYQVGAFSASNDNIRIYENGINWEHHKPGYHAVRTNTGCCAADSNWLRYILDGDYDEIGYLATSQRDGSGHIFNYIKQDGWYYFVDLTHYRTDWVETAVESGNLDDYYRVDFVLGNIHKVQNVQDYVAYIQNTFNDPPGLMFLYTAENCLAVDGVWSDEVITITYEKAAGVEVQVVFDDPSDLLEYSFVTSPVNYPDWTAEASFDFSVIGK